MKIISPPFSRHFSLALTWLFSLWFLPVALGQKSESEDMSHIKQSASESQFSEFPSANIMVQWKDGKVLVLRELSELQKVDRPEEVLMVGIQYAGLKEIPSVLRRFNNIILLDLSHNALKCEAFSGLSAPRSLRTLYVNDNLLDAACMDKLKARHPKLQFVFSISQLTQKPE